MKQIIIVTLLVFLSGCTFSSDVAEEDKNKEMSCTDTRDGEKFSFNTNDITDVQVGLFAETSFDVIDNHGIKRTITSRSDVYLKCLEVNP